MAPNERFTNFSVVQIMKPYCRKIDRSFLQSGPGVNVAIHNVGIVAKIADMEESGSDPHQTWIKITVWIRLSLASRECSQRRPRMK